MRLLADVSAHGYGHMMQTACVLDALAARESRLDLTLRTDLSDAVVKRFWTGPATRLPAPLDPALAMSSPDTVDAAATAALYRDFPARFAASVAESEALIERLRPDTVFADVAAPGLVAARRKGVPALALCSLNWAGVLRETLPSGTVEAETIACFEDAYAGADAFLMPAPSMSMPTLANARPIGPIGRIGTNRADAVRAALGLGGSRPLGIVSWGGWAGPVRAAFLDALPDEIDWIVDPTPVLAAGIPHIDLIASCAILIGKPGYGTFVEAVANRVRLLHTRREGWPETVALVDWAQRHGCTAELAQDLAPDDAAALIRQLMSETPPAPPALTGADEAADALLALAETRGARSAAQ